MDRAVIVQVGEDAVDQMPVVRGSQSRNARIVTGISLRESGSVLVLHDVLRFAPADPPNASTLRRYLRDNPVYRGESPARPVR